MSRTMTTVEIDRVYAEMIFLENRIRLLYEEAASDLDCDQKRMLAELLNENVRFTP